MEFLEQLGWGVIIAAIIIGVFLLVKKFAYKKQTSISSVTVAQSIRNIGTLETAEYVFTRVEVIENSKRLGSFMIPLTKTKVIFSYTGRVIAGVNLLEATVEEKDNEIVVKLPKAQVRAVELFDDTFRVYDERMSIFNMTGFQAYNDTTAIFKEKGKAEAVEYGLLTRADDNARLMVEKLIKALPAAENKEIVFKEKSVLKSLPTKDEDEKIS